ncbi:PLP-dependent aminotransferase family protein [Streptomyces sp. ACA25]|nr:PLP-dependent aminotransferase family protein [Streptomyces sp. ACA25]MDB1086783.1 PLP-dependent aminotransferase family protein [Streptomyces sp. ACA25]
MDLRLDLTSARHEGGKRERLMRALREAVTDGRLASGTRLPSSRSLAADLGVARNTVSGAYAELTAEGWLVTRQGSGTRVARRAGIGKAFAAPRVPQGPAAAPQRRAAPRHNLVPGTANASSFPRSEWLRSARRALTAAPSEAFGPGDPQGRTELRETLAGYLARARGVRTTPDRVVVCAGFAHGLRLLSGLAQGPVAVEEYGLGHHRTLLSSAGLHTVVLPVDQAGAVTGPLTASGARTVLLTPAHQFPTGGPLEPARRAAVIDWARSVDGLVLEDDYDGEFRYDRQPVGALQSLDPERAVYLGTVSKSLSPALRLGWMVLPRHLVPRVLAAKGERELRTSILEQLTLADFMGCGAYDRHVRRMRRRYQSRRDQLRAALEQWVPEVRVSGIAAGLHAVLDLPDGTEDRMLAAAARHDVAVRGLGAYRTPDSPGAAPRDGLVVGYGTPPDHGFPAAVSALCQALREGLGHRPGDARPDR